MLYVFLFKRLQWISSSLVTNRVNLYSTIYLPVDCNSDSYLLNPRSGPNLVQTRARNVAPNEAPRRQTHWYAEIKANMEHCTLTHTEHVETCWNCSIYAQAAGKTINKMEWSIRGIHLSLSLSLCLTLCSLRCYLIKQKQFNLIFIHATGRAVWGPVYHGHFCHFCA